MIVSTEVRTDISRQRVNQIRFPERRRAREAIAAAIKRGFMKPATEYRCSECGQQADQYHHHLGYQSEFRFAVLPICEKCHGAHPNPKEVVVAFQRRIKPKTPLAIAIIERQVAMGLSRTQMAEFLGVGRASLSHLLFDKGIGRSVLRSILSKFPDLASLVETMAPSYRRSPVPEIIKGTLIEKLIDRQRGLMLTEDEFPLLLGISTSQWWKLKNGKAKVSPRLLKAVNKQFPELYRY